MLLRLLFWMAIAWLVARVLRGVTRPPAPPRRSVPPGDEGPLDPRRRVEASWTEVEGEEGPREH